jgi:phosphatidylserine/phosphatidylglycerophosphate/cardiolipin synthase-like enzyme
MITVMKNYFTFILIAFCLSSSIAQDVVTKPIATSEEIVQVIDAATQELLLSTDTFRNQDLANAVNQALLERGVGVYVLVPETLVTDLSSYFGTLERSGASVHTQETTGAFLIVDRKYVIQGPMLSELETANQQNPTVLIASTDYAHHLTKLFIEAFEGGRTWKHVPQ